MKLFLSRSFSRVPFGKSIEMQWKIQNVPVEIAGYLVIGTKITEIGTFVKCGNVPSVGSLGVYAKKRDILAGTTNSKLVPKVMLDGAREKGVRVLTRPPSPPPATSRFVNAGRAA